MNIGTLTVQMAANLAQLQQQMNQAQAIVGQSTAQISASAGAAATALGAIGAAAAITFGAVVGAAIKAADEIDNLSQRLGIQHTQLSAMRYMAEQNDISFDGMAKSVAKLSKNMVEATAGNKEAAAGFAQVGVKVKDSTGQMRSSSDVLEDVAEKFGDMEDGAGKTALAMKLFGKSGVDMIPFLNQGKAGLQELRKEAELFGLTVTAKSGKAAADFLDNIDKMGSIAKGVANQFAEAVSPALRDITGGLIESAKQWLELRGGMEKVVGVPVKEFVNSTGGPIRAMVGVLAVGAAMWTTYYLAMTAPAAWASVVAGAAAAKTAVASLYAVVLAHPFVAIAAAIAGAAAALWVYRDSTVEIMGETARIGDVVSAVWDETGAKVASALGGMGESISRWIAGISDEMKGVPGRVTGPIQIIIADLLGITKEYINTSIGAFVALAEAIGIAAGHAVELWQNGFANLKGVAVGFWDGVQKVFKGDLSFTALQDALTKAKAPTKTAIEDIGNSIKTNLTKDWIATGQKIGSDIIKGIASKASRNQSMIDFMGPTTDVQGGDKNKAPGAIDQAAAQAAADAYKKLHAEYLKTEAEIQQILSGTADAFGKKRAELEAALLTDEKMIGLSASKIEALRKEADAVDANIATLKALHDAHKLGEQGMKDNHDAQLLLNSGTAAATAYEKALYEAKRGLIDARAQEYTLQQALLASQGAANKELATLATGHAKTTEATLAEIDALKRYGDGAKATAQDLAVLRVQQLAMTSDGKALADSTTSAMAIIRAAVDDVAKSYLALTSATAKLQSDNENIQAEMEFAANTLQMNAEQRAVAMIRFEAEKQDKILAKTVARFAAEEEIARAALASINVAPDDVEGNERLAKAAAELHKFRKQREDAEKGYLEYKQKANENTDLKIAAFAAKTQQENWLKMRDDINNQLTDSIMDGIENGFNNGKSFAENFKSFVWGLFRQPIKIAIQAVMQPIANDITSMIMGGPSGGSGGIMGMLGGSGSSGSGLFGNLFGGSSGGGGFGAGGVGSALGEVGELGELFENGASGGAFGGGGGLLGGLGGLGSILPWAGVAAGVISMLSSKPGGPKTGGSWDYNLGTGQNTRSYTPSGGDEGGVAKMAETFSLALGKTLTSLGIGAKGYTTTTGYELDPKGTSAGHYDFTLMKDGQAVFSKWIETAKDDMAAVAKGLPVLVIDSLKAAIQDADVSPALKTLTSDLDGSAVSIENLDGYLAKVNAALQAMQETAGLAQIGLTGLGDNLENLLPLKKDGELVAETFMRVRDTFAATSGVAQIFGADFADALNQTGLASYDARQQLVDLAGGIGALTQQADFYYQNFYTAGEQLAMSMDKLLPQFQALGFDHVPKTRDEFRLMVESLNGAGLSVEEFNRSLAGLLALAPEVAQVTDASTIKAKLPEYTPPVWTPIAAPAMGGDSGAGSRDDSAEKAKQAAKDYADFMADINESIATFGLSDYEKALHDLGKQYDENIKKANELAVASGQSAASESDLAQIREWNRLQTEKLEQDHLQKQLDERQSWQDKIDILSAPDAAAADAIERQIAMNKDLASTTDEETKALIRQAYAMDAAAEAAKIAAEAEKKLMETRQVWQDKLDVLMGNTTEARLALERDLASTTDAATKQLIRRVYQLDAEKQSLQLIADNSRAATDAALAAVERAADAEKQRLGVIKQVAEESASRIRGVFDLLNDSVKEMQSQFDDGNAARDFIRMALDAAKTSGYLPDQTKLGDAIRAVSKSFSDTSYKSALDQQRDTLVTSNRLAQLRDISGRQLTEAERQVKLAEDQLKAIDEQTKAARESVDALRGLQAPLMSLSEALAALTAALGVESVNTIKPPTGQNWSNARGDSYNATSGIFQRAGGELFSTNEVRDVVSSMIESGNVMEVYDWVKNAGMPSAVVDQILGYAPGSTSAWAQSQGLPAFASGGMHTGGLRLVGEHGPEIEGTGAARYWSASDTRDMMRGDGGAADEVRQLREDQRAQSSAIAGLLYRLVKVEERWDTDGIPEERVV